uniref:Putative signal recognition particle protein n=2 Tax=Chaetomium thermophilum (strain DSM 1495 / CBS 144.50 / IMI 039719) TaxID=759272 RepID=UPI0006AD09C7|nr:Chain A, Putative signal recognition particle protein [Thermochaetoides thermophila DSM 1495]5CK4_B Chain B, Putative signal recognition particle protein [Thermochaetoides thermophila DSM 1495]5CK5_A Chain A, Putative signal recognition particle protein [Thermochaetoides thermophila DSM 1495]5CK5_B Chain B, Putative signal recognition particle protein [Thermochaetoides thermophila DSM 1495]5CK5_C Chain C, Putative signal recognition particle protein [Thermochaetoides thermophila DSM 1495]5C
MKHHHHHHPMGATTQYTTLPSVLLIGPSGAGKTALLTLFERGPLLNPDGTSVGAADLKNPYRKPIVTSPVAQTHTSQVPTSVELAVGANEDGTPTSYKVDLDAAGATARKFLLIDTPGHPKLRGTTLQHLLNPSPSLTIIPTNAPNKKTSTDSHSDPYKSKLKAVIFLLDAAALADSDGDYLSQTASYLYDVLLSLQKRFHSRKNSRAPSSIPVLIAANKQDLFTAVPASLVKSRLEHELGRIRKTRQKGLLEASVTSEDEIRADDEEGWLGAVGSKEFKFEEMMEFDMEVEVMGGNVIGDGPGAERWWRWIGERI